jgi:hypothetical protein
MILIATVTVFALCWLGVFSNQNVEIADHLQDVLESIVGWLLILSAATFICSFLGAAGNSGTARRLFFIVSTTGCCILALAWLAFVNSMRRN